MSFRSWIGPLSLVRLSQFRLRLPYSLSLTRKLRSRDAGKIHRPAGFGGLPYFFDRALVQRLVDLNQHVLFINFDGLDLGVTTAQNAATQPKKYRCDVAIARARLTFGHLTQNEIIAAAQPSSV
jgi:hypothetical protein